MMRLVPTIRRLVRWTSQNSLYGPDIIEETYRLLTKNEMARVYSPRENKNDEDGFWAIIGDATGPGDCSRRIAYMRYEYFSIVPCGLYYAIGFGKNPSPHYYVGDRYANDIMILWSPPPAIKNEEELRDAIEAQWCHAFRNSPVVGLQNGDIQFGPEYDFDESKPGGWLKGITLDSFTSSNDEGTDGNKKTWKKELSSFFAKNIAARLNKGYEIKLQN